MSCLNINNCGIYSIENTVNNKVYIGSSIDTKCRIRQHKWMLKSNGHDNIYLQRSFNKYGKANFLFKIIELCSKDQLVDRENYYINLFDSSNQNKGYNLALVCNSGRNTFTDEVKIKNSTYNLKLYGNFTRFKSVNILTREEREYTSLVEAAYYLINNGYSKGQPPMVRQNVSRYLRKIIDHDCINPRKSGYKHEWIIIN